VTASPAVPIPLSFAMLVSLLHRAWMGGSH
jgi:hypothetical protein